jgi:hypothetical protein
MRWEDWLSDGVITDLKKQNATYTQLRKGRGDGRHRRRRHRNGRLLLPQQLLQVDQRERKKVVERKKLFGVSVCMRVICSFYCYG